MIHHWKALDLEIKAVEYHVDRPYAGKIIPSEILKLKHVDIIRLSDKLTYDTSFESSCLGGHRFRIL